jgi:hypothetical protein
MEREERQKCALLRRASRDDPAVVADLEWPKE